MKTSLFRSLAMLLSVVAIVSFTGCGKSDGKTGEASLDTLLVSVPDDISPVAVAGADVTVQQGVVVTLDGSGSYDPDGTIVLYQWQLTDGTILGEGVTLHYNTASIPAGTYQIVLLVTDDRGATGYDTMSVTVVVPAPSAPAPTPAPKPTPPAPVNQPPEAKAGEDQNIALNFYEPGNLGYVASRSLIADITPEPPITTVQLNGTGSTDDGLLQPLTYAWEPLHEGQPALNNADTPQPNFDISCTYAYEGINGIFDPSCSEATASCAFTYKLTVDDGQYQDSDEVTINVDFGNCMTET